MQNNEIKQQYSWVPKRSPPPKDWSLVSKARLYWIVSMQWEDISRYDFGLDFSQAIYALRILSANLYSFPQLQRKVVNLSQRIILNEPSTPRKEGLHG